MTYPSDFHRDAYGSIDFDHYRRLAARARTTLIRRTVRRFFRALRRAAGLRMASLEGLPSLPVSRQLAGGSSH